MLHQHIKEQTHAAHQNVEGTIVRQLKNIRSETDYAEVLKGFYAYFRAVEDNIAPFITTEVLPDLNDRRNSTYIKKDIEVLGSTVDNLPEANAPQVNNILEALASLYVLEGSIMGGPYIVQMLNKYGINSGTSFFEGYGDNSREMWAKFTAVLNKYGEDSTTYDRAVAIANQTFYNFGDVFTPIASAN
ncbi:biliverdin-producing heme oxygenase [Sphingobacterium sp. N143]|uniref:biliverdin-producing heme oxygenase n=1 Tax=Sphingobacterium sp. N143 TaxID=2746727 RepID=UPI002575A3F6|nr:biliverdin-producing heme oxygenase [Sphingobacterium sp. N143]MDM1296421.1 biliverdin-producing heme oxygenase [Sphingobacterium sp. N143]